ncbi:MAG TPA: DUF2249 domain-containing protein [Pyrinomonadaceae bacterium]|nr:DUF2249 domain-containing protein [Pyrinomonadaceae bacterium]
MQVTEKMKIKEVLAMGDHMLDALVWLSPEFERLQHPKLRRAMGGRVTVGQAARIARIPLAEALFVLNLATGSDMFELSAELKKLARPAFEYTETNPPRKPFQIAKIDDSDPCVNFVDVMDEAERRVDPMPRIAKGLVSLKEPTDVLLIHHPFDPIPLRDMFARRGFGSWAEERTPGSWYIYFFKPTLSVGAIACPAVTHQFYIMAAAAGSH